MVRSIRQTASKKQRCQDQLSDRVLGGGVHDAEEAPRPAAGEVLGLKMQARVPLVYGYDRAPIRRGLNRHREPRIGGGRWKTAGQNDVAVGFDVQLAIAADDDDVTYFAGAYGQRGVVLERDCTVGYGMRVIPYPIALRQKTVR